MNKTLLLYIIIILEGYAVLSCEMLAIRQMVPFVGSGTDTVSIIIAAVLMPLAIGYHAGGQYRPRLNNGKSRSVRRKLVFNVIIAQAILLIGLSYYPLSGFFFALMYLGIKNRILQTVLYCLLFIILPVFLLGQTIPLVSNYFSKEKLSLITGRMLFFSTLGSFLGAILTTLVLMATIGVHFTTVLLSGLLTLLVILLSGRKNYEAVLFSLTLCGMAYMANSQSLMEKLNIVSDNQYNTVVVYQDAAYNRHMILNGTAASMYSDSGRKHPYIELLEQLALKPILYGKEPRNILVVGAGAFTFGFEDDFNNYDFVDLDKNLKNIAEGYILREKLTPNHHFYPMEARAFLMSRDKKYDLILLDTFSGSDLSVPEHLVTREFYQQVRAHLKQGGVVTVNFIASPNFGDEFSRHIDNTFRSVFPYVSRYVVQPDNTLWDDDPDVVRNAIYFYRERDGDLKDTGKIYTDDVNSVFYDKPRALTR